MTSKAYFLSETEIKFVDTGSTPNALFTCTSLAAAAGQQSAQYVFPSSPRAYEYNWTAFCKVTVTTLAVGETVDVYLKTEGTSGHILNDDGLTDALLSSTDKLNNLQYLGSIVIDEVSATVEFVKKGRVVIKDPKVQVVFVNNTGAPFTATAADHGFILEPTVIQGQAT